MRKLAVNPQICCYPVHYAIKRYKRFTRSDSLYFHMLIPGLCVPRLQKKGKGNEEKKKTHLHFLPPPHMQYKAYLGEFTTLRLDTPSLEISNTHISG